MRKLILAAPIAVAAALAVPAMADLTVDAPLGPDALAAHAALVEAGYDVREMEQEDGKIEFEAMKDGVEYEIYVDATTGKVLEIEED